MLPIFPQFKPLELSDREAIDAHTALYPPYSDFEFGSIWAWDVKEEMAISSLNGNLVVRFTDYTTGEPFLSFLGSQDANETAAAILSSPESLALGELRLVPEIATVGLDPNRFRIEESPDHFDYVCDVSRHVEYDHAELHAHRKLLRQFREAYPHFEAVSLDVTAPDIRREIADVYRKWDENKGFLMTSEAFAYERFLEAAPSLSYSAVGIRLDGALIAFHVVSLPPGTCAHALFGKADTAHRGIYPALDHVVARDLLSRGYTHMNIQQDLGIENLRRAKMSLHPVQILKKYAVSLR